MADKDFCHTNQLKKFFVDNPIQTKLTWSLSMYEAYLKESEVAQDVLTIVLSSENASENGLKNLPRSIAVSFSEKDGEDIILSLWLKELGEDLFYGFYPCNSATIPTYHNIPTT